MSKGRSSLELLFLTLVVVMFLCPIIVSAEDAATSAADSEESDVFTDIDEAARKSSNPLGGDFMILLNQIDNYFMEGNITSNLRDVNVWAFQPVVPIPMKKLGENWIWVNRPTFPFIMNMDVPEVRPPSLRRRLSLLPRRNPFMRSRRPTLLPGGSPHIPPFFESADISWRSKSGFGDLIYFSLLGQSLPTERWGGGDFVWAVGPTGQFPTASRDEFGTGRFSAGPAGVLSFIGRKFILGGLFQQWNSFGYGGKGSGQDVNFSWLNLFYFLNFRDGWQVGGTPVITADWEADDDDRWTVPIALGVYKTSFFGRMPIKMGLEFQYMPVRPDIFGQEFNIRVVLAPIIPSFFKK
jgi:hypothetical protein